MHIVSGTCFPFQLSSRGPPLIPRDHAVVLAHGPLCPKASNGAMAFSTFITLEFSLTSSTTSFFYLKPETILRFKGFMWLDCSQPNNLRIIFYLKVHNLNDICKVPLPYDVTTSKFPLISVWAYLWVRGGGTPLITNTTINVIQTKIFGCFPYLPPSWIFINYNYSWLLLTLKLLKYSTNIFP